MNELTLFDQMDITVSKFYNTTGLEGDKLKERQKRIGGQNKLVLDFFRSHSYENFTPWEVSERTGIFIVSVRRAMTDLTDMGYLIKLDGKFDRPRIQRMGEQCELNFAWQLA